MLISFEQLKSWLDCKQDGDVERKLLENKIPYHYGIGGKPVTTLEAVNKPLIGKEDDERHEPIEFG